jgi:hypothetical protein
LRNRKKSLTAHITRLPVAAGLWIAVEEADPARVLLESIHQRKEIETIMAPLLVA